MDKGCEVRYICQSFYVSTYLFAYVYVHVFTEVLVPFGNY